MAINLDKMREKLETSKNGGRSKDTGFQGVSLPL